MTTESPDEMYQIGVDIGGTNTDIVVMTEAELQTYKTPTVKDDLAQGVLNGIDKAAVDKNRSLSGLLGATSSIVHGSTIGTNALLEGEIAKTGLLATDGFRDVLETSRFLDEDDPVYDFRVPTPESVEPEVPRYLRRTVDERIDSDGAVVKSLDADAVATEIDYLVDDGVDAIAVSFMFSYLNDAHERQVADILDQHEDVEAWSLSSDVFPKVRIRDRTVATVVNASLKPVVRDYLRDLESRIEDVGFDGTLLLMQANGGLSFPNVMAENPITSLNSGPTGGTIASGHYGDLMDIENVLSIDMGGTSCDVSLIRGGSPTLSTENKVGDVDIPIQMVDINTIGAGGGSIAWIDDRGVLRVGPESAGADPGPLCYDNGGERPTVTDANLILGYLNPDYFLGGETSLNTSRAREGLNERLGDSLDLTAEEAAAGIYEITNEQISNQIRQVSVQRGYDPRDFTFVAAGGAAPIHAATFADRFDTSVIIPQTAGTLSAFGLLQSDIKHGLVRSITQPLSAATIDHINEAYESMENEAQETLGDKVDEYRFERSLETLYEGQVHEISISMPDRKVESQETIERRHHERHEQLYTFRDEQSDIEVEHVRLTAVAVTDTPHLSSTSGTDAEDAVKDHRQVFFEEEDTFVETPIYDGERTIDDTFDGPGIVETPHTTVVVPPNCEVDTDEYGNFVLST